MLCSGLPTPYITASVRDFLSATGASRPYVKAKTCNNQVSSTPESTGWHVGWASVRIPPNAYLFRPRKNHLANAPLQVTIESTFGAPRVLSVDSEGTDNEGLDCGVVVVHLDSAELKSSPPAAPSFRFNVTAVAEDSKGGALFARDGDDHLNTVNRVDARYDITTGSGARRWASVTELDVSIELIFND